jgi:glycosyltransferase involved in cell wall biosynthesis
MSNFDKVDVVILTKNSALTLKDVLQEVVCSIPFNNIIIVDGDSTDETLDIARQFGAKIIKGAWNLAFARRRGVLEVETEWFCFIDSDIYVFPSWYRQLERHKKLHRVVWVQGLTLEHSDVLNSYALSKTLSYEKFGCIAVSNSLLRRDVVLECTDWLRNDIHAGEDSVLHEFIKSKGFRVLLDCDALCLHLPDCFFHDIYAAYRLGYSNLLRRKHIPILYLGYPILFLREAFIRVFMIKDLRLLIYLPTMLGASYVLGLCFGHKESRIKRLVERIDKISKSAGKDEYSLDSAKTKFGNTHVLIEV